MLQTIINETQDIYSRLNGVQAAAFSFWMICVAFFYGGILYMGYLGIKSLIQKIKPQR